MGHTKKAQISLRERRLRRIYTRRYSRRFKEVLGFAVLKDAGWLPLGSEGWYSARERGTSTRAMTLFYDEYGVYWCATASCRRDDGGSGMAILLIASFYIWPLLLVSLPLLFLHWVSSDEKPDLKLGLADKGDGHFGKSEHVFDREGAERLMERLRHTLPPGYYGNLPERYYQS